IEQVGASAAVFNPDKLLWVNAHYIKTGDPGRIALLLLPHLERLGLRPDTTPPARLERIIVALRERSRTLKEMAESAAYFFTTEISLDEKAEKLLIRETLPILKGVRERLEGIPFEHAPLEEAFKSATESMGMKLAQIAQPVRAAVTGKTVSPGIFDVLEILGKEKTLKRLDRQIEKLTSA
ncbi:MAG TPA: hypothetical protein VIK48_06035, partial [Candidatus Manganitrophaceae bacterium]